MGGEEGRCYGGVGEDEEEEDAPDAAEGADDEEFVFPGWEGAFDVPDPVAKEPTECYAKPIRRIPYSYPNRLLASGIPHGRDEHECWIATRFSSTTECTKDSKLGEVLGCGLQHEEETPEKDVATEILPNWKPLHQEIRGKGPSQKTKIENTRQPRILHPNQPQILPDPKDSRIAQGSFINVKERIADGQIGQNHEVDFADESFLLAWGERFWALLSGGIG